MRSAGLPPGPGLRQKQQGAHHQRRERRAVAHRPVGLRPPGPVGRLLGDEVSRGLLQRDVDAAGRFAARRRFRTGGASQEKDRAGRRHGLTSRRTPEGTPSVAFRVGATVWQRVTIMERCGELPYSVPKFIVENPIVYRFFIFSEIGCGERSTISTSSAAEVQNVRPVMQ